MNPDSEAIPSSSTVSVTLAEMGSTVIPTLKLRTLTFSDIDPAVANIVARKLAESVDPRVRAVLDAGTQVARSNAGVPGTSKALNTLTTGDTFKGAIPQTLVAKMRGATSATPTPSSASGPAWSPWRRRLLEVDSFEAPS